MKCRECGGNVTRKDFEFSRWRLYRIGYTRRQVQAVMPRCSYCNRAWIDKHHRTFEGAI